MRSAWERAAAGAAFLDERRPNWAEEVEPDHLDMNRCDSCVLGQLCGIYDDGVEQLVDEGHPAFGDEATRVRELGFLADFQGEDPAEREDYKNLTDAWRAEITKRTE